MLDLWTILLSIVASGGVAFLAVKWLAQKTIEHGFALHLTTQKAALDEELTRLKNGLDAQAKAAEVSLAASLRRADEMFLGEEAAERSYRFDAQKRLYSAVGPLRFQLIVACAQLLSRLHSMRGEYGWGTSMEGYFGRSFLYRLARPIALAELIENQIAYADFSVDPAMIHLLQFRGQIHRALCSADVPLIHPGVDWSRQKEHIFRDQLAVIAIAMIVDEENGVRRLVRFDEFETRLKNAKATYLQPLTRLVADLDPTRTPIFWLRLLAIGQACEGFLQHEAIARLLGPPSLAYQRLIEESQDPCIRSNAKLYQKMLADFCAKASLTTSDDAPMK